VFDEVQRLLAANGLWVATGRVYPALSPALEASLRSAVTDQ